MVMMMGNVDAVDMECVSWKLGVEMENENERIMRKIFEFSHFSVHTNLNLSAKLVVCVCAVAKFKVWKSQIENQIKNMKCWALE